VNRSLTEGRKRFFDRFAQIESGEHCEGFRPLVSAACDGEASSEDERRLSTHLRGCQSCRAAVRAYRAAPGRLAELLPPALLAPLLAQRGGWWSRLYESLVVGTGDRAGALGYKLQQAGDLLSAQKATAVVASTAAIAGGTAVHKGGSQEHPRAQSDAAAQQLARGPDPEPSAGPAPLSPAPTSAPGPQDETDNAKPLEPATEVPEAEFGPQPTDTVSRTLPATTSEIAAPAGKAARAPRAAQTSEFGP
jgi:hypothetical protein